MYMYQAHGHCPVITFISQWKHYYQLFVILDKQFGRPVHVVRQRMFEVRRNEGRAEAQVQWLTLLYVQTLHC